MKNKRQLAIVSIINEKQIKTHEQIVAELEKQGFNVTQATVSRDIKELCLIKRPDGVYTVSDTYANENGYNSFSNSVKSVEYACNMIVIKTDPGAASAIAAFIDNRIGNEIMGSIAGDDTVFIVLKSEDVAKFVCTRLKSVFDMK